MDRKQNVHYRPLDAERSHTATGCLTCKNRIFVNLHDSDGRLVGQDFRCPVIGIEYPIVPDHTCDKHRPVRQVTSIVDAARLEW
jgi:hypothetical protein